MEFTQVLKPALSILKLEKMQVEVKTLLLVGYSLNLQRVERSCKRLEN